MMYFNNIIYIIIAIIIIAALINFALWLLPYALIGFAVYWLYKKLFAGKGKARDSMEENVFKENNTNKSDADIKADSPKKVIDVDYEEVDD